MPTRTIADEVELYLRTGDSDVLLTAWPGELHERGKRAHEDLRGRLVREVRRLAGSRSHHPLPIDDTVALTRSKVEPMIRGLFPKAEAPTVLSAVEKSVVFLSSANIEQILFDQLWNSSAWDIANLFLASVGADLLGENAPRIVGMSEEQVCYVSAGYFAKTSPFADFIVHEVAHIFHNCKRETIGLEQTRTREWLLDIEYSERETFAYSCEAYSQVFARATNPAERRELALEYARAGSISADAVDPEKVAALVIAASTARNGWKVILENCAPPRRARARANSG